MCQIGVILQVEMEGDFDNYDDVQTGGVVPAMAELPEIKLFGRWTCDDVQVSDMSLQVRLFGSCIVVYDQGHLA